MGFRSVGADPQVSRDARFFAITGTLGDRVRIDAFSVLTGDVRLGDETHVSPFSFLSASGGVIELGARAGISSHVSVYTKSADYRSRDLAAGDKLVGDVRIGANSVVGTGSTVMPGVVIGPDVSVGCNCVVAKDIAAGAVVVTRGLGLVTLGDR